MVETPTRRMDGHDVASERTPWTLGTAWANRTPNATAIVSAANLGEPACVTSHSWEELMTVADELRERLAACGVRDQRTVVMALPNAPLTIALWLAIMANGAIVQAVDADAGPLVLERALRATDPAALIVERNAASAAAGALAAAESNAVLVPLPSGALQQDLGAIPSLERRASAPTVTDGALVASLLPTSGTSGAPKLVELTAHSMVLGAERLARNAGFLQSDRHYLCAPFAHTNAQLYLALPPFVTGGSMAIVPRFSASRYFEIAATTGATVSSMVAPPMRLALHRAVESGRPVDAGPLRLIQYGMTMSAADWAEWDRRVPQIEMRQIYGQTESVTGVLGGSPWEVDDRTTIGRPYLGVEAVKLVSDDGSQVADGEPGELWVAGVPGVSLMRGYHQEPGKTAETIVDGQWLRTGDVMVRSPNGRFEFRGRQMHIIRRGGENLSTYALENDLKSCPYVSDVAVTSIPDAKLDALVVAHVIPSAGYSDDAFIRWCREQLGKRGTPDSVRVHREFPRTVSGRVITRELQ